MPERRRLTTLERLKVVARQALCPLCGEKLGDLSGLDFDHVHALALGGTDTLDNLRALHRDCHSAKTNGRGGTSAGSDKNRIAKVARCAADEAEFRRRLLAKEQGEKPARKSKIPSRPFRRHEMRKG